MKELANDIAIHGVLQNLVVAQGKAGRFDLIAGHRRLAAVRLLGLETVPARVVLAKHPELVQLAENIHREELSLEDQAKAIRKLYDATNNVQEVADLCHKARRGYKRLARTYSDSAVASYSFAPALVSTSTTSRRPRLVAMPSAV